MQKIQKNLQLELTSQFGKFAGYGSVQYSCIVTTKSENKKLKIPFIIIYIHKDHITRNISKEKVCKSSSLKLLKHLKHLLRPK